MKLNVEADVGIEDISRAIITELNSSEADEVTGAADELLDSSAGNQFVRIYDALAHQLHCEWDPEIPGCVTEARLELVKAAQEIINSEASLQEVFEIESDETRATRMRMNMNLQSCRVNPEKNRKAIRKRTGPVAT